MKGMLGPETLASRASPVTCVSGAVSATQPWPGPVAASRRNLSMAVLTASGWSR